MSRESDISQWRVLLFQLNTENINIFPRRIQNVYQFIFEFVSFTPDQALCLK